MKSEEYIKQHDDCVMGTYGRFPLVGKEGKETTLVDSDGKEYIDLGSGIGVNSLGYCNDAWVEAVCKQVKTLNHVSNYYYSEASSLVAKKIITASKGMSKLFFGNSGAEANEGAIKLARKYSFDKYGEHRNKIITLNSSFHGRTLMTLEATGQDVFHQYFFPFTNGFLYSNGDMKSIEAAYTNEVCGVMIELVQGEGGVNPLDKAFVQSLRTFTKKYDLALIVDEVQTGIGRTGTFLAYEQFDIIPDIVTIAKGIAGGLPMGCVLCSEEYAKTLGLSHHGSTFGGNPISSAGASVVMDTVANEEFLSEVVRKGEYIRKKIDEMNSPYVAEIKGMGLMLGVELKGIENKVVCKKLFDHGVLALTAGNNVLRFLPPLIITNHAIDNAMKILAQILKGEL